MEKGNINYKPLKPKYSSAGFTIIESMLVLAIVGLIMSIVFIAIHEVQISLRDNHRKTYANSVVEALEEFYKNNGKFPGCSSTCTSDDAKHFITNYLPAANDPSSGNPYNESNPNNLLPAGPGAITTPTHSLLYLYAGNDVEHNIMPAPYQIYIAANHWCYASTGNDPSGNGPTNGPPLAGINGDPTSDKFAVVIYQERGGYYCVDNYAAH